jgi:hypothetical protein
MRNGGGRPCRCMPEYHKPDDSHVLYDGCHRFWKKHFASCEMLPEIIQNESELLKLKLEHYKELFDKSISDGEPLEKTKIIFHELKKVVDMLDDSGKYKTVTEGTRRLKNTQPHI